VPHSSGLQTTTFLSHRLKKSRLTIKPRSLDTLGHDTWIAEFCFWALILVTVQETARNAGDRAQMPYLQRFIADPTPENFARAQDATQAILRGMVHLGEGMQ
jgi:hypothetical protein